MRYIILVWRERTGKGWGRGKDRSRNRKRGRVETAVGAVAAAEQRAGRWAGGGVIGGEEERWVGRVLEREDRPVGRA